MSESWAIHAHWILQLNLTDFGCMQIDGFWFPSDPCSLGVGLQSGSPVCYSSVRSSERVETMMEFPAGPFRDWSRRSLTSLLRSMHGLGCVTDVSSPRAWFLESIFLLCCRKNSSPLHAGRASEVFSLAGGRRHQDKSISVVPAFPFFFLPNLSHRDKRDLASLDPTME